mmetsp:Transcript_42789/g.130108  ORF Transcript_42789/g.130108 Transcript_42789/m.130108 type:complete len:252 (-) Transcript_42789:39-794(-)
MSWCRRGNRCQRFLAGHGRRAQFLQPRLLHIHSRLICCPSTALALALALTLAPAPTRFLPLPVHPLLFCPLLRLPRCLLLLPLCLPRGLLQLRLGGLVLLSHQFHHTVDVAEFLVEQYQQRSCSLMNDVGSIDIKRHGVLEHEAGEPCKLLRSLNFSPLHLGPQGAQVHRIANDGVISGYAMRDWVDGLSEERPRLLVLVAKELEDRGALLHDAGRLRLRVVVLEAGGGLGLAGGFAGEEAGGVGGGGGTY